MTNNNEDYEMCLRAEGVVLPKAAYFGLSAATGGLADDHDVFHFLTTSLHATSQSTNQQHLLNEDDQAKLTQEYQDYQKKLEITKEEYRKDHPDEKKDDMEDWFESDNQRELRQIWQAQSQMADAMRGLSRKMDEVIGRQERTMGLLSINAQGVGQPQLPQGAVPGGVPPPSGIVGDTIRRHEVDMIINNQNIFLQTIREIRTLVGDIYTKEEAILQNQARQPTAQVQQTGYDVQSLIVEMRDGLNQVKQGIAAVGSK